MSKETTEQWKTVNADYYREQQKEYRRKRYANDPETIKKLRQEWRANNPDKTKVINNRKTVLYKKMVEVLTKNNSPLLQEHTADELYQDLVGDCNILFCVVDTELHEYLYSRKIGTFYYRRNFYAFAEV